MSIRNLFKNKEQAQQVKELPIPQATRYKEVTMQLCKVSISYNQSMIEPFKAHIGYAEGNWQNPGLTEELEFVAKDWPTLVDKVIAHFEGE